MAAISEKFQISLAQFSVRETFISSSQLNVGQQADLFQNVKNLCRTSIPQ